MTTPTSTATPATATPTIVSKEKTISVDFTFKEPGIDDAFELIFHSSSYHGVHPFDDILGDKMVELFATWKGQGDVDLILNVYRVDMSKDDLLKCGLDTKEVPTLLFRSSNFGDDDQVFHSFDLNTEASVLLYFILFK